MVPVGSLPSLLPGRRARSAPLGPCLRLSGRAAGLAGLALIALGLPLRGAPADKGDAPPQLIVDDGLKGKTVEQLRKAVAKGDPAACLELGVRLIDGNGVPVDQDKARGLFEQAAKGGLADAWFRLGKIYCGGLGVPTDYAKGFNCYTEAANRGVPEAQHNIGAMLVSGRGVKRDYVEGLAWIIVAGKAGAASDAEQQVRARLAKRPADIAAAEARAAELQQNLEQSKPVVPKAAVLAPPPKPVDPASLQPEKPGPPKVEVTAPKIEIPLALPTPAPTPDKP